MESTQVEGKFVFQQQEKYTLTEKKELGELNKNVPPPIPLIYSDPPRSFHIAVFSTLPPTY